MKLLEESAPKLVQVSHSSVERPALVGLKGEDGPLGASGCPKGKSLEEFFMLTDKEQEILNILEDEMLKELKEEEDRKMLADLKVRIDAMCAESNMTDVDWQFIKFEIDDRARVYRLTEDEKSWYATNGGA